MEFSYAGITRDDPNPLKRWLQRRRLSDALAMLPTNLQPGLVVDYGGGDGELSARVAERFPTAEVICFEPVAMMAAAARVRLGLIERARVATREDELPSRTADVLLCTEVFEHLPEAETTAALDQIQRVLSPGGLMVIGVPVEIGPPALAKGLFRSLRRPGSQGVGRILAAAAGRAVIREREEIEAGRGYHYEHLGFNHQDFERLLSRRFVITARRGSPLRLAPSAMNSELYLLARLNPSEHGRDQDVAG